MSDTPKPGEPAPGKGLETADLQWDQTGQLRSRRFGDVYFSPSDGLAESRYVFLNQNRLTERFRALSKEPAATRRFAIGETGFGSGLNFLTAWQLWREQAPTDAQLHFVSVERYPLRRADLQRALGLWPELAELADALVKQYPPLVGPGFHRLHFDQGRVCLTLIFDDARQGLAQLLTSVHPDFLSTGPKIDAWFLDGFAPAKNAEMWTPELFATLAYLSRPGTTLATYTSAGLVKRGLAAAGFAPRKAPGFASKQELLTADYVSSTDQTGRDSMPPPYRLSGKKPPLPWALSADSGRRPDAPRTALIIGAGLAGCHSARALAERGWRVTVLEQHARPAQEASGNPQGLLYAKLSPQDSPLTRFNLLSLCFAQRFYRAYWRQKPKGAEGKGTAEFGAGCGLLQVATTDKERQLQTQVAHRLQAAPELVRPVGTTEASDLAGLPLPHSALYFPHAGWLNPGALCEALLDHPGISLGGETTITELTRAGEQWCAREQRGQEYHASIAVLANARAVRRFTQTETLPLKAIRGQITQVSATDQSRKLNTALCGDGYLAPADAGQHCLGATFNLHETDAELSERDQQRNLDQLAQFGPDIAELFAEQPHSSLGGRVAFRCTTPDYLPLVGPAPDRDAFLEDFAPLRKDARLNLSRPGRYHPGLFINVGHGSRGLCYTPLSAELLAAHIEQEPMPLDRELVQALHPARFLIRDLMRNKV